LTDENGKNVRVGGGGGVSGYTEVRDLPASATFSKEGSGAVGAAEERL